jgi:hypothetical protein
VTTVDISEDMRQAVIEEWCVAHGGHDYDVIEVAEGMAARSEPRFLYCTRCERRWRVVNPTTVTADELLAAVAAAAHALLDEDRTSWSPEHADLAQALAAVDTEKAP